MSTAAHAIDSVDEFRNPNVVKVVLDADGLALYFSRAPIPWWRDGLRAGRSRLPLPRCRAPLRHIGIYGYRAGFLRLFPALPQAPVEAARGAGAAARAVARPPDRGACDADGARPGRRHARGSGARARRCSQRADSGVSSAPGGRMLSSQRVSARRPRSMRPAAPRDSTTIRGHP